MSDRILFILVVSLMIISVVFSYSLSTYLTRVKHLADFHFFIREFSFAIISFLIIITLAKLDPDKWFKRIGFTLFFSSFFVILIMGALPYSICPNINGARRWIRIGGISIAPMEFFKIGFIFFLSWSLTRKVSPKTKQKLHIKHELVLLFPYLVILALIAFLVAIVQSDFGQFFTTSIVFSVMLLFVGVSFRLFMYLMGAGIFAFIALIFSSPYRILRIKEWWYIAQDYILNLLPNFIAEHLRLEGHENLSYQVNNGINAIYHGGFTGTYIGNGIYKLGYLSDVHTDFVLAGIAEETGIVGIFIVLIIFLGIIWRCFVISNRSENYVYHMFALGIGLLIAVQFIINSFGISGLLPLKGITVPFLSYGGSSMIALSIGIGMVLMIGKKIKKD